MRLRNILWRFLPCFIGIYVFLIVLWIIADQPYCSLFSAFASQIYTSNDERELDFELYKDGNLVDTRAVIVNRRLMNSDGAGIIRNFNFSAFSFAWKPCSLLIALIIATPIAFHKKLTALLLGVVILHILVLIVVGICIWSESGSIGLVRFSQWGRQAAIVLKDASLAQLDVTVPMFVWIIVCFKLNDWHRLQMAWLFGYGSIWSGRNQQHYRPGAEESRDW